MILLSAMLEEDLRVLHILWKNVSRMKKEIKGDFCNG